MPELRVPQPVDGLSDEMATSDQPPTTLRDVQNMRIIDPVTGRTRLSQRSGLSRYVSAQLTTTGAVKAIQQVTYDQKRIDYAVTGVSSAPTEWGVRTPSGTDTRVLAVDRQSNVYVVDSETGLAKYNSEGTELYRVSVPVQSEYHVIRAITVDDFGGIYVGTSGVSVTTEPEGGQQKYSRLWRFQEQINEEEPEEAWVLKPPALLTDLDDDDTSGAYIEDMVIRDGRLYTVQNQPKENRAFIRVYQFITSATPELAWESECAYPANAISVSEDGAVFVASEENAIRSTTPASPDTTKVAVDWTPDDLDRADERIWGWWKADDSDGFGNSTENDGESIERWKDITGNQRDWIVDPAATNGAPTFRAVGSAAGRASIEFPADTGLVTGGNTTTAKAQASLQRTALPGYSGFRYATFIVGRAADSSATAGASGMFVMGQDDSSASDTQMWTLNTTLNTTLGFRAGWAQFTLETDGATGLNGWQKGSSASENLPDSVWYDRVGSDFSTGGFFILAVVHRANGAPDEDCEFWVNGEPCDTWSYSVAGAVTITEGTKLGHSAGTMMDSFAWLPVNFSGEVFEMITLRDYEDEDGTVQVIETPGYPDNNYSASSDTEIERMIGYLAWRWGLSDILPKNESNMLSSTGVIPVAGETVVIDGITYTYRAALPGAPASNNVDVLLGGTFTTALTNLDAAINDTGTIANYEANADAAPHPSVRSVKYNGTSVDPSLTIQVISPRDTGLSCTETSTQLSWEAATTSLNASSDVGVNAMGNYPQPFYLLSGPPRLSGLSGSSAVGDLLHTGRLMSKHGPEKGDPIWVMKDDTYGGVGYGVVCGLDSDVFSMGPDSPDATGTTDGLAEVRRVIDDGDTFQTTSGDAWTSAIFASDSPQDPHPRMDTDEFGNLYVPTNDSVLTTCTYVYDRAGTANVGVQLHNVSVSSNRLGYAVRVDPDVPDYEDDLDDAGDTERAEFFYVTTLNDGDATAPTIHKIRLVTRTPNGSAPRLRKVVGVANGLFKTFTTGAVSTPTDSSEGISSAARFVSTMSMFGKAYFTDGRNYIQYDPKADEVTDWESETAGKVPAGGEILSTWRGRAIVARFAADPQNWAMSKVGDPDNWDFFPPVATTDQAVIGNSSQVGVSPDIVNGVVRINDDLLIFLGDSTVQRMTGDPAAGGQFDLISDQVGGAFGKAWTKDPDGNLYWFGAKGGIYRMAPPYVVPQRITVRTIEERLRQVDLATYYVWLEWNWRDEGLHVFLIPFSGDAGGVEADHYFLDAKHNFAPWRDRIGASDAQITAAALLDGDDPDDRVLVLGHEDTRVRRWDKNATNDDTNASGTARRIDAYATQLVVPGEVGPEYLFSALDVVLANGQGGGRYELRASDEPDLLPARVKAGELAAGRNSTVRERMRGAYCWLTLGNAKLGERFSVESARLWAVPRGRRRVRT